MNPDELTYAVVTPARNEAADLPRLATSLIEQTFTPRTWVIVDHGSTDDTGEIARQLAAGHSWIDVLSIPGEANPVRGGPIVQAFSEGLGLVGDAPAVVVKLDADVSFEPDHFARLLNEFATDPTLGIASSTCWERDGEEWSPRLTARSHVRGAVRAYRRECLEDVTPLERRFGWDTIDELKAQLHGWTTRTVAEIPFFHHRATGARDGGRRTWEAQGKLAWYLGYRFPYLLIRTVFRSFDDWHALAMLSAWAGAGLRREPRYPDTDVLEFLRDQQSLRHLRLRAGEVIPSTSRKKPISVE